MLLIHVIVRVLRESTKGKMSKYKLSGENYGGDQMPLIIGRQIAGKLLFAWA